MWLWFRPITPKRTGFSPGAAIAMVYHDPGSRNAERAIKEAEDARGVGLGLVSKGLHVVGAGHDPQLGGRILRCGQQPAAVLDRNAGVGVAVNEQDGSWRDPRDGLLRWDGVQVDAVQRSTDQGDARRKHLRKSGAQLQLV